MTDLKPCPFCGSDNLKVHLPYFVDALYQIQCYNCNCTTALYKTEKEAIERWNTRFQVGTENMAIVSDEFICKKCGIYLKDYIKVVMDEDNDGYIDEQHYDYEPKFCPECGAKVERCIKTPKRDKPLYTMDEICKMNGGEQK